MVLRCKKYSDILEVTSGGRAEIANLKAFLFSHFQFQLRFLKGCILAVLSSKMSRCCPSNVLQDILGDNSVNRACFKNLNIVFLPIVHRCKKCSNISSVSVTHFGCSQDFWKFWHQKDGCSRGARAPTETLIASPPPTRGHTPWKLSLGTSISVSTLVGNTYFLEPYQKVEFLMKWVGGSGGPPPENFEKLLFNRVHFKAILTERMHCSFDWVTL